LSRDFPVRAIARLGLDEVWVGTYLRGLFRLNGHLWIGSEEGIFRVSKADLETVAEGRARRVIPFSPTKPMECHRGKSAAISIIPPDVKPAMASFWLLALREAQFCNIEIQPPPLTRPQIPIDPIRRPRQVSGLPRWRDLWSLEYGKCVRALLFH
jgi:hypothetical protein